MFSIKNDTEGMATHSSAVGGETDKVGTMLAQKDGVVLSKSEAKRA